MTDPIDIHVGNRIRHRRWETKLSQTDLGRAMGVTFQQLQKYEKGENRIAASRLYKAATTLDVPVGWFFEGLAQASREDDR